MPWSRILRWRTSQDLAYEFQSWNNFFLMSYFSPWIQTGFLPNGDFIRGITGQFRMNHEAAVVRRREWFSGIFFNQKLWWPPNLGKPLPVVWTNQLLFLV